MKITLDQIVYPDKFKLYRTAEGRNTMSDWLKSTDREKLDHLLPYEETFIATDNVKYMDCLNNKPLKDRDTDNDIRQGLLLFWVYIQCCYETT